MKDEKEQLSQIIKEYDNVVSHFERYSIASRGAIRPGETKEHIWRKRYSGTKEFIAWTTGIRYFLNNFSVAGSKEAEDIIACMENFRGLGEETKLEKLYAMLNALYTNWDLISHGGAASGRLSVLGCPKLEFKCFGGEGSVKSFVLKNVSSVYLSEIKVESFDLIFIDGSSKNLFFSDIDIPTSLGPNETKKFTYCNNAFKSRSIGSKIFKLILSAQDEVSNQYCFIVTKDVDNLNDKQYMLGEWSVKTECNFFSGYNYKRKGENDCV